ncbi:7132_t:CDS:2, partial [Acaulospora colombiana]
NSRALPRMSWAAVNLYHLWARSLGPLSGPDETSFRRTFLTLFQQRWKAKRLVRGYHGDQIGEKKFKRYYLPEFIPDVRPRRPMGLGIRDIESLRMMNRTKEAVARERKAKEEDEELASAPVGSLMFIEVERRLDTIVFRSCLSTSVYQARHLVLTGKVKLNGVVCKSPGKKLEPGDMISVEPTAISFLQQSAPNAHMRTSELPVEETIPEEQEPTENSEFEASATESNESVDEVAATEIEETEAQVHESKYCQKLEGRKEAEEQAAYHDTLGFQLKIPDYAAPFLFVPAYLEVSFVTCSAVYVRHPTARKNYSELPTPYEADGELMRLAWEWYVKVRPRMRGRLQRETGPHGTRRPVPYWSQYQR